MNCMESPPKQVREEGEKEGKYKDQQQDQEVVTEPE